MATSPAESQVPLRLRPDEQWLLHVAVASRIEAARRSKASHRDPAFDDRRILRKVENGAHLFTPDELDHSREALLAYRQKPGTDDGEAAAVGDLVERIETAIASRSAASPN